MKKLKYLLFSLCILVPISTNALSASEIKNRDFCNTKKVELAYANIDGSLSNKACFDTYQEAKKVMDSETDNDSDNLVIIENGMIVDAKYALIDYEQKYAITYIYKNKNDTSAYSYIKGGDSDDAVLLEVDYSSKKAKIKVSGLVGWIHKYEDDQTASSETYGYNQYDIIPLSWAKTPSYYEVGNLKDSNGKVIEEYIRHVLPNNLFGTKPNTYIKYGKKPAMLNLGKYYSYDGIYFYNNIKTMINDYKNNVYTNAINKDDPYYNFYLYLNYRTKSNYTSDDIDQYIELVKKYTADTSKFYSSGKYFEDAQNNYGINLALMFAVGANESTYGTSAIAMSKNNLFGLNAVDSSPGESASIYESVEDCINTYAYSWLSYGYIQPGDYRWHGSNLGNKNQGLNVKYASDPYWGESAAARYYELDKYYDFQDYNSYQQAVLKANYEDGIKVYKDPNGLAVSSKYYRYYLKDSPIVILKEVTGPSVDGNTTWYQITSDPNLNPDNMEYIGDSKSNPRYLYYWDKMLVYVPATYFVKINIQDGENLLQVKEENPNPGEGEEKPTPSPSPSPTPSPSPSPSPISPILKENPNSNLITKTNNNYYFNQLEMKEHKLTISGHLSIQGMNNLKTNTKNYMIFKNMLTNKEYYYKLDSWTGSFEMNNPEESVKYDYSGGWFKSTLDLSFLPQGDYQIYIEVASDNYKVRRNFNNLFYKEITRKNTSSSGRGYQFLMNYLERSMPMELTIRDNGLISSKNPPTNDMMYNTYTTLTLSGTKLRLRGTSHNVGINYSSSAPVERTLVFENISTFKRKTYDIGSITTGDYQVTLKVSDGFDKTRVWYDTTIDLASANLESGVYAIYFKTKVSDKEDYGELNDILFKTLDQQTTINGKKVFLRRVNNKRYRIELVIE